MKKNKVGRPAIAESKKRSEYICVSCTKQELSDIKRKAKEYNVRRSALIRMALKKI
jgi:hypothetical protein